MNARISLALLLAAGLCACSAPQPPPPDRTSTTEKSFVSGGRIDLQLAGGDYTVQASADDRIRVTMSGNIGDAKVDLTTDGTQAAVKVTDTPHNNFRCAIEVPKVADLVMHLAAGNLVMAAITGNKDINSNAGNIEIAVGDPNDYSSVQASVNAGDLDAGAFGESKSGLLQHVTWSGPGKYGLRANLMAGSLVLKRK